MCLLVKPNLVKLLVFSRDMILEGKNGEIACFGGESNGLTKLSLSVWGGNLGGEISPKGPEKNTEQLSFINFVYS